MDKRISQDINGVNLIERVEKQNITAESFYIQKAELEIETQGGELEKVFGSFKFQSPDKYLISIKSRTGIEVVRIFISEDTVLVNDRINKKLYYGSVNQMNLRYGISCSEIPIIFGDIVFEKSQGKGITNCMEGNMRIDTFLKGAKINYTVDCRKGKLKEATISNSFNKDVIDIAYSGYFRHSSGIIPGIIKITDLQRETKINIKFRKIETPWNGEIDFIPGKKYEILQLP